MPDNIRFTDHAIEKFGILRQHGIDVSESFVEDIVRSPAVIHPGYGGRMVAQGPLDERRVLRVVYEATPTETVIVTFYPGKRERYDQGPI